MEPFEKYLKCCTPRVKKLFTDSQAMVAAAGGTEIAPEHILMALMQAPQCTANKALADCGMSYNALAEACQALSSKKEISDSEPGKPVFTDEITTLLKYAFREARAIHYSYIGLEQILLGMFFLKGENINKLFERFNIDKSEVRNAILKDVDDSYLPPSAAEMLEVLGDLNTGKENDEPSFPPPPPTPGHAGQTRQDAETQQQGKGDLNSQQRGREHGRQKSILANYGKDLTELAKKGAFDPVIGRTKEIQRITQILCRRIKNNAVLLGEAGVGKTAIVEGLAMNIAAGRVPKMLLDKHIFALDVTLLVAGTQYRGQFEERMAKLLDEVKKNPRYILFLDEMHTMVGAGSGRDDGLDVSNIMKPALSRGEIQCIGATTIKEYRATIEKNTALARRFQSVMVSQPSPEETVEILNGLVPEYEHYHNVKYNSDVINAAVALSVRYLPARCLPDKAIDIIDEAGSMVRLRESEKQDNVGKEPVPVDISMDDIRTVISGMSGVPLEKMKTEERQRMLAMAEELGKSVIGQSAAVNALSKALKRSRAELSDPNRPIGSFLFVGPSGVGKSLLAKTLAEFMFHDKDAVIRLDMSEYSESFNISKMIGSAPGYVGYEEGGNLTEQVRRKPYSVVLFDEIEKAHPMVVNILLQILEEGQLSENSGNTVSFRNTIVIMTSNLGSEKGAGVHSLGFGERSAEADQKKIDDATMASVKKFFRPELLNRIDEIVFFRQLCAEDMRKIARLEIAKVERKLERIKGRLQLSDDAFESIMEKAGDAELGARMLRRAVEEVIEDRLADELLKDGHPTPFTAVVTKDSVSITE